jgi:hypothetical protein
MDDVSTAEIKLFQLSGRDVKRVNKNSSSERVCPKLDNSS